MNIPRSEAGPCFRLVAFVLFNSRGLRVHVRKKKNFAQNTPTSFYLGVQVLGCMLYDHVESTLNHTIRDEGDSVGFDGSGEGAESALGGCQYNGFLPTWSGSIPLQVGKKPFLPFSTLQVCLSVFLRRRLPYFG